MHGLKNLIRVPHERERYMRVVDFSAAAAARFVGVDLRTHDVLDGGPADPDRYKPGARVWLIAPKAN